MEESTKLKVEILGDTLIIYLDADRNSFYITEGNTVTRTHNVLHNKSILAKDIRIADTLTYNWLTLFGKVGSVEASRKIKIQAAQLINSATDNDTDNDNDIVKINGYYGYTFDDIKHAIQIYTHDVNAYVGWNEHAKLAHMHYVSDPCRKTYDIVRKYF